MRKPSEGSLDRIRDILQRHEKPFSIGKDLIEALAIDRDEVMETGKRLGEMGAFERGRVMGAAEGRQSTMKEIKIKYRLVPRTTTERIAYIQKILGVVK